MRFKVEHRVGVPASSKAIWDVLSDLKRWNEWNTLYPEIKGLLRIQQRLAIGEAFPGQPDRVIRPMVVDWVPNEQIIWRLSLFWGLLRTTRYIEIESLGDESSIFSNGEIFDGPLLSLMTKGQKKAIKAGFTAFGEAVRDRAEADWRGRAKAAI